MQLIMKFFHLIKTGQILSHLRVIKSHLVVSEIIMPKSDFSLIGPGQENIQQFLVISKELKIEECLKFSNEIQYLLSKD